MEYEIRECQNKEELDQLFALRKEVFVLEQGIPEHLDQDGLDENSKHVIVLTKQKEIVAGGRLSPQHELALGVLSRIVVKRAFRGKGLGPKIIRLLEALAIELSLREVQLKPHAHLEKFYHELGYQLLSIDKTQVGEHPLLLMSKELP